MTAQPILDRTSLLVKDKLSRIPLIALCLFILLIPAFFLERASKSERSRLKARQKELSVLSSEYKALKERLDTFEHKKNLRKTVSTTQALEDTLVSLNLKAKLKSVKITGSREIKGTQEEVAEVILEKVTMNELVNLFYRIENGPARISVKKINIKKAFENPELLNVSMTAALFSEK